MSLCIILIIAHKQHLTETEKASLLQCYKVLGKYPIRFICPKGLDVNEYKALRPDAQFEFIDPKWQASYVMFGRLKVVPFLYRKFSNYKYILFYELDAWVFRDELEYWCNKNYDYIGAPWVEGWKNAASNAPILGVGNGGFSLRKVKSHLKVLHSFAYIKPVSQLWQECKKERGIRRFLNLLLNLTLKNNTFISFNNYYLHEDVFWGMIASSRFSWFKTAPVTEALRFSVEAQPERFIKSVEDLPFGCHAWPKTNPSFWKQYIHQA